MTRLNRRGHIAKEKADVVPFRRQGKRGDGFKDGDQVFRMVAHELLLSSSKGEQDSI